MTKHTVIAAGMCLTLAAVGCSRRQDPSAVSREPLARATPAVTATPSPEPKAGEAPSTAPVKADKPTFVEAPAKKLAKSAPSSTESKGAEPVNAAEGLKVKRLVITRSIDHREPAAAEQLSASDEPLFAFVELENKSDAAESVVVTFERDGKSVGHIKLEVPAKNPRWRTWGKTKQVRQAGSWVAVVKSADGKELARKSFVVG